MIGVGESNEYENRFTDSIYTSKTFSGKEMKETFLINFDINIKVFIINS